MKRTTRLPGSVAGMDFRVLGPVEVSGGDGAPVLQLRRRERLLLGLLLLESGRLVPVTRLAELLWGDDQPANPRRTLTVYASRIRSALESSGTWLEHRADGYLLDVEPRRVDAHRFTELVARARELEDPQDRCATLARALQEWRGPVLADVADEALRRRVAGGLEDARLTALERRIVADLALGRHETVLTELADLVEEYPTRERLVGARMTALHRCGRTSDALDVYQGYVNVLGDTYGLDAGDQLTKLYVGLLRNDPDLAPPLEARVAPPAWLPPDLSSFVGRGAELGLLCTAPPGGTGHARIVGVDGMSGVGKTALAVHAAHQVAAEFPDGQLYLDLRGFTVNAYPMSSTDALDRLLRGLGTPPERIPHQLDARSAALRSALARKRVLLLLDNAADEDQVRPLLPAADGCTVFITSRTRLSGLDDVTHVHLPVLTSQEAAELLHQVVGGQRLSDDATLVDELARLCGRLPLAVRIAAARLRDQPQWTMERFTERLRRSESLLSELESGQRGVASALEVSYQQLAPAARRVFRLLSLTPSQPVSGRDAAVLSDLDYYEIDPLLADLVNARMLDVTGPDRYRYHDLTKHFGREIVAEDEVAAAVTRLVNHYRAAVADALTLIDPGQIRESAEAYWGPDLPDRDTAVTWLEYHRDPIRAVVDLGLTHELDQQVWQLCNDVVPFYMLRQHVDDWLVVGQQGLVAARRLADRHAEASMLGWVSAALGASGNYRSAREGFQMAAGLQHEVGDRSAEAASCNAVGAITVELSARDDDSVLWRDGYGYLETALQIYQELDDQFGAAKVLANQGEALSRRCRFAEALPPLETALAGFTELGKGAGRAFVLVRLGNAHASLGGYQRAFDCLDEAYRLSTDTGSVGTVDEALLGLGDLHRMSGDLHAAQRFHDRLASRLDQRPQVNDEHVLREGIAATYTRCERYRDAAAQYRLLAPAAERVKDARAARRAEAALRALPGTVHH